MSTAAVELSGVTARYGQVLALDDVTLTMPAGRITAVVGVNGSGKSTMFKLVMGALSPWAGSVQVLGHSTAEARRAGLVAYVPQAHDVDWDFPVSVREVVATGRYGRLGLTRRLRPADRTAVESALDDVGLAALADRQIGELSGGQRKRAFVARAIAQEASVLLLDEPFAGVDTVSQDGITAVLKQLRKRGTSVVVSTHELGSAPDLADHAVVLHRSLVFSGPAAQGLAPEVLARAFGVVR